MKNTVNKSDLHEALSSAQFMRTAKSLQPGDILDGGMEVKGVQQHGQYVSIDAVTPEHHVSSSHLLSADEPVRVTRR